MRIRAIAVLMGLVLVASACSSSESEEAATVTLDNGESFTFSIICNLEPQEVADVEILYTAVSN